MAEFDPHETIDDALDAAARGLVKRAKEGEQEVEYFSPKDLIDAANHAAAQAAKAQPHFGLRYTKCVPPGAG